jgi:hypothetical protein
MWVVPRGENINNIFRLLGIFQNFTAKRKWSENKETKLVQTVGNANGNGLGLFRPFPKITIYIRYFTIGNEFVNFLEKY